MTAFLVMLALVAVWACACVAVGIRTDDAAICPGSGKNCSRIPEDEDS